MCRGRLVALCLALAMVAGCGGAERGEDGPVAGWQLPNADLVNSRHVASEIDRRSVGRLRVAWTVPIGSFSATPIVVDGVVFAQDMSSNVSAIELESGRVRWTRRYDLLTIGPNGLTFGDGRIYGATTLFAFALDASTGRELWRMDPLRSATEGIDMAPGYHDGTVFVSTVPSRPEVQYGGGARGVLWALDGKTGRPRWRWATVPSGLWGDAEANSGGGLWHPPSFDGDGHVFASVANPGPLPGTERHPWGGSRPGPNRWTNSIVKLDERTGELVWARQVLPHDIFDWDLQCPVLLTSAGGRDLAIAAGKMGFVYAFDADSGTLRWKRSVGVHNGHDDDNLKAMRGEDGVRVGDKILPGLLGGVQTQMAMDDATIYVPVNDLPSAIVSKTTMVVRESTDGAGQMVALDAATGRVRWDRTLPDSPYGAAAVTNDLVFTTTYDGTLWAFDTRNGETAWRARLPAGSIAPVAIAGDTVIAAAGVVLRPGQPTQLVAYRLGE